VSSSIQEGGMAGYLTIIIWMGAAMLVLKGVEIYQIAITSSRQDRGPAVVIGIVAAVLAVASAGYAIHLEGEHSDTMATLADAYPMP
jgi:hypothetical protein